MKALRNLIGNSTYMVADSETNRFNFFGLVEVDGNLLENTEDCTEWDLTEDLPEDVEKAITVMVGNDVPIKDYTGIVTFDYENYTYYLLTW